MIYGIKLLHYFFSKYHFWFWAIDYAIRVYTTIFILHIHTVRSTVVPREQKRSNANLTNEMRAKDA